MSVQLQYLQLIVDKTNTADLTSGVFTTLLSVTRMLKYETHFVKTGKQRRYKGRTEVYRLCIAADSTVDVMPLVLSSMLLCDPKTSFPQIRIYLFTCLLSYLVCY